MNALLIFLHLVAAVTWMGGMGFILLAMRPAAFAVLQAPVRPQFILASLQRFFPLVWLSIAVILLSGLIVMLQVGFASAPVGWHAMLGIGLVMMAIFAGIYFAPFRRARAASVAQDWPAVGRALEQIHPLVVLNFTLGWIAIALVLFWH
ncbi:MAG: CopD family protein [Thiomonas sp.]